MPLVRGILSGAKTLLAHFHYVNNGQYPFELDWSADAVQSMVAKFAKLDYDQREFVGYLAREARKKSRLLDHNEMFLTC